MEFMGVFNVIHDNFRRIQLFFLSSMFNMGFFSGFLGKTHLPRKRHKNAENRYQ
jgi:hypothetical protein